MQTQANTPRKSIFEGMNVKVRQIDLPPETALIFKANTEYGRLYDQITEEEIRELPPGIIIYPPYKGIYRTISGKGHRDHIQLIHYPQPVLGGSSTSEFLHKVKGGAINKDDPLYKYKEYVGENYWGMCMHFPYAAQVAYDLYKTGELSDKSHSLKRVVDERYSVIVKSIKESNA